MSARGSVEMDARRHAARELRITRKYRRDMSALELLGVTAGDLAREAARLLVAGDVPSARRYAHAHQLVAESATRLSARHERERAAELEREAAEHGIKAGEKVRVTGANTHAPAGAIVTVEDVSGILLWVTVDGERHILWAKDVERVEPPADVVDDPAPRAVAGDKLIVRGIGAQATVLDVHDGSYSVRYDDAPDVLLCPFSAVVQVLAQTVAA